MGKFMPIVNALRDFGIELRLFGIINHVGKQKVDEASRTQAICIGARSWFEIVSGRNYCKNLEKGNF